MSATAKSPRARRGRILIVGDAGLPSNAPPEGVVVVTNLFEALGQITIATAAMPISTVVLFERLLAGTQSGAIHAIQAIRKIDPSVRIVMIASPERTSSVDWRSQGVDECMNSPIQPEDLGRLVEDDVFGGDGSHTNMANLLQYLNPPAARSEPPALSRSKAESPGAAGLKADNHWASPFQPREMPIATSNFPVPPRSAASVPPAAIPESIETITNADQLGDTDLVEAIMTGMNAVREVAMQLIAQQTNWTDLTLEDEQTTPAEPRSNVRPEDPPRRNPKSGSPVEFNGAYFGVLASSQAGPSQLQPWADWLARWLTLDQTHHQYRILSLQDDLTGAGNRRFFDSFLNEAIDRAAKARRPVTLMVFDIDNFKMFNDQFGHDAGDDILRETVKLMQTVIRQGDRVCRIGGDEFAVIFADDEAPREPGSKHPESIESIAKRFQDQICKMRFPKLGSEAPGTLTISAGLATYPWDGTNPEALLRHADQLALESKRKGKNIITFGQGAMRACRPVE